MDYRERYELKEYRKERRLDHRVRMLHAGIVLVLMFFLVNFWYLQVVRGDRYRALAENNRLRKVELMPARGVITDRSGEIIASTRPSLKLVLRREDIRDAEGQIRRVAPILGIPMEELWERYSKMRGRPLFEPLVLEEDIGLPELARIESRRELFPSVEVHQIPRRSYPDGSAIAHALGYVGEVSIAQLNSGGGGGLQRGDIVGKAGIERAYDDDLRGSRGWKYVSVNNLGRRLGEGRVGAEPRAGSQMRLTLDLEMQRTLVEAFGDEAGAGVFMEVKTGEILALVSAPTYDPNEFADGISMEAWDAIQGDSRQPLHNRAIASFYAPGSTFKVLVAIAALEDRPADAPDRVWCNGSAIIYGSRRLCWKRGGHGWVGLREAVTYSCNVFFYQMGKALGIEPIHRYGSMFRLGQLTEVDLPGESAGILPSSQWKRENLGEIWYPGDTISVAIGQGLLAVTPIQLARMMSAVATGGRLPWPHLHPEFHREPQDVPISQSTFAFVQSSLEEVVREGTGRSASIPGITVAGKTGTAQVYKHSAGVDSDLLPKDERDHAWFAGYAGEVEPEIAFAIVVEHGGHGGSSAAPIARRVLEVYFDDRGPRREAAPELRAAATDRDEESRHGGATASR
jgi:penicillin-binding protein 2